MNICNHDSGELDNDVTDEYAAPFLEVAYRCQPSKLQTMPVC